jgi:hypothetical protein
MLTSLSVQEVGRRDGWRVRSCRPDPKPVPLNPPKAEVDEVDEVDDEAGTPVARAL